MVDVVDRATRSRMMSGIRSKNTRPELFVRKGLHALGFRFRLHDKGIPGTPDLVLPKFRTLINVHGCFWHGHGCRHCKVPSTNTDFWLKKIGANCLRDNETIQQQLDSGWRCLVIWECAIRLAQRRPEELDVINISASWLNRGGCFATIDERGLIE